jgi:endogenous inhibitor of DNA gyrase (YacG/DUF329 family)
VSTPNPTHIDVIAHALADASDDGCFDNPPCCENPPCSDTCEGDLTDLDEWHSGEEDREHWTKLAHASVSKLTDAGYSIVSYSDIREMIGPSREVDSCPRCEETVAWEKNGYDLRDNDDDRYSWVAYCEACSLHLELTPFPNPPFAAAAEGEKP